MNTTILATTGKKEGLRNAIRRPSGHHAVQDSGKLGPCGRARLRSDVRVDGVGACLIRPGNLELPAGTAELAFGCRGRIQVRRFKSRGAGRDRPPPEKNQSDAATPQPRYARHVMATVRSPCPFHASSRLQPRAINGSAVEPNNHPPPINRKRPAIFAGPDWPYTIGLRIWFLGC
jgi:hypothetical protein